jgi:antitoxin CptB
MTMAADIRAAALYMPVTRPRPGIWRLDKRMTQRSSEGLDVRRKRLLFRAWRRGVRETDLIVGRFADAYIDDLDEAGLDQFEKLIEAPNAELFDWVTGAQDVPPLYDTAVLAKLRTFHRSAGEAP